jgi:hypothetical protein
MIKTLIRTLFIFILPVCLLWLTPSYIQAQDTLVYWNFPNNPDDDIAEGGVPVNLLKKISATGPDSVNYTYQGASGGSDKCAAAMGKSTGNGWDNGSLSKFWMIEVNTTGFSAITLSSKQRSSDAGPRNFKLQYRIGTTGSWFDVAGGTIVVNDNWTGVLNDLPLPANCANQSLLFLRWILTSNLRVNQSIPLDVIHYAGTSRIDDIFIKGSSSDYFRSKQSGNWESKSTWEQSSNNINWVPAFSVPNFNANTVTTQSGHTVSITASLTIDQLEINSGSKVIYQSPTLTINDGTGVDLMLNGTFEDGANPGIIWSGTSSWIMGSSGALIRTRNTSSNFWKNRYAISIINIPSTSNWIIRKTGAENPSITSVGGSNYPNLTFENFTSAMWVVPTSSSFTGSSDFPRVLGNLDIGGQGTGSISFLNENAHPTPVNIRGNMLVRAGNIFRNFGTGIEIEGNLTVEGSLLYDIDHERVVKLGGNKIQEIHGSGIIQIHRLIINKSTNDVTLFRDITVDSLLQLDNGPLILNSKTLTIDNPNSGAIIRNNGLILAETNSILGYGFVKWKMNNVEGDREFPFGNFSPAYIPVTVSVKSGNAGYVAVSTYRSNSNNTPFPATVTHVRNNAGLDNSSYTVDRFWIINPSGLSSSADITFSYSSDENASSGNFAMEAQRWNANNLGWEPGLPNQQFVSGAVSTVTVNDTDPGTIWAIAFSSSPLPVELLHFSAHSTGQNVHIQWTTGSEKNTGFFIVEKSLNGFDFYELSALQAAGHSSQNLYYELTDHKPALGINYYRLNMIDQDGKSNTTLPVAVKVSPIKPFHVSVLSNLGSNYVSFNLKSETKVDLNLKIYSSSGQIITNNHYNPEPGNHVFKIDFNGLSRGLYVFVAESDSEKVYGKFMY